MKYRITSKGDGVHFYGYDENNVCHEVIRDVGGCFFIAVWKQSGLNYSWNPIPKKNLIFVED